MNPILRCQKHYGLTNVDGARFCVRCGRRLEELANPNPVCACCGRQFENFESYCPSCGQKKPSFFQRLFNRGMAQS